MSVQRIDFFHNRRSQYGVLEIFRDGLQKALRKLNVASDSFEFEELEEDTDILPRVAKNHPDCTAGFNILLPRSSPIESLNLPHLSILVDFCSYYPEILRTNHIVATFVEEDSCGFLQHLGFQNALFLPHAIDKELLQARVFQTKRNLDVVMSSSYVNPEAIIKLWRERLSKASVDALLQMAEEVLSSPHRSHLQAFVELTEQHGPFEKELLAKKLDYFSELNLLEIYIRNIERQRLIQSITDYEVHMFCSKTSQEKWQEALKNQKNVIYHDEVPFAALPSIFQRAKVVINSIPFIKRGLHERLLVALSQGASCLSNENSYISSQFPQNLAVPQYLGPNYTLVNELIANCLQDEEARLNAVKETHALIGRYHTWDVRAETLVKKLPPILKRIKQNLK